MFRRSIVTLSAGAAGMAIATGATLASGRAEPQASLIVPAKESSPGRGPELRLPGLPPIQLPPGARVYGPEGDRSGNATPLPPRRLSPEEQRREDKQRADRERDPGKPPANAKKEAAKPKGRDAILTDLFNRLGKAQSPAEARGIVGAIERAWLQSGSDTADLLMQRTLQAMKKKNYKLALRLLDKMVVIEPGWAEIWNQRATARYYDDNPDGAVADIAEALAREPRHFSALVGLGLILRRANQEDMALKVLRRAIQINPQLEDIKKTIEKLQLSVEGQGI